MAEDAKPTKTFELSESTIRTTSVVAAVLLFGGMVATYVRTETTASHERGQTNEALKAVVETLKQANIATIPMRLKNIEDRVEGIRQDRFTVNDAELVLWHLKDAGIPIEPDKILRRP